MLKVVMSDEATAFCSGEANAETLRGDPKGYVVSRVEGALDGRDVSDINVVENSTASVHVVLPYYDAAARSSSDTEHSPYSFVNYSNMVWAKPPGKK